MHQSNPVAQFKPRLVMFRHLTQRLVNALQESQQATVPMLKAPNPVRWDLLTASQHTAKPIQVQSLKALALPEVSGIPAQLLCPALESAQPETTYDLPEIQVEILGLTGELEDTCQIPALHFTTFAYGHPAKQILEFWATVLDSALQEHGFSCQRQHQQLCFKALQAGRNLRISQLHFEQVANPCTAGLRVGLTSTEPPHQPDQTPLIFWGPYQINQRHCEICLPAMPERKFCHAFLEQLNRQLEPTSIQASWTAEQHLMLTQAAGQRIEVSALDVPDLNSAHQLLDLPLPTGHYQGQHRVELGQMRVNGIDYSLTFGSELRNSELSQWLTEQLNQLFKPAQLQVFLEADSLCFRSTDSQTEAIEIRLTTLLLQEILGFSELNYHNQAAEQFQQSLKAWQQLRQRLQADCAQAPVLQGLSQTLERMPSLNSLCASVWQEASSLALNHLKELLQAIEYALQQLPPSSEPATPPQLLNGHTLPVYSPSPAPVTEALSEQPPSRFDHQI